jgi:pyridoxine 5-phosphate synthase
MSTDLRLGVNIDHVATIRNARGGGHPDPVRAARAAALAGADSIVAHLREDRRHIADDDLIRLMEALDLPLTLEMAATDEMLDIALRHCPETVCIVPEKREERTTEGGLDVAAGHNHLARFVDVLGSGRIIVSMFIEPDPRQLDASRSIGAPAVELHTGAYCEAVIAGDGEAAARELERIAQASAYGVEIGLEIHAGHGLTFDTVSPVAAISEIVELNIGHFLIGEAIFGGLESAIVRMRSLMDKARAQAAGSVSA